MTMTGYFNESATAKCPIKDYFPFLQWMLDVPNLVKILCKSKQNIQTGDNCFTDAFTIKVRHSFLSKLDKTYQ